MRVYLRAAQAAIPRPQINEELRRTWAGVARPLCGEVPQEQIFYGEFDGRRRKRVLVKIIGD